MSDKKDVFELPSGLDTSLQVIPASVLQEVINTLEGIPAKHVFNIMNILQRELQNKSIQPLSNYLTSLHNAKEA